MYKTKQRRCHDGFLGVVSTAVYHHVYDNRAKNKNVFLKSDKEFEEFTQTAFKTKLLVVVTWHKVAHFLTKGDDRLVTAVLSFLDCCWLAAGLLLAC